MEDHVLIKKLEHFIRKYYKNLLIRGLIFTILLLTSVYLLLMALEFIFYFNTYIRTLFFISYLVLFLYCFLRYILSPVLKLNKIGETLTYEQAATIIGEHFTEIQDKLLNALQLIQHQEREPEHIDLIIAGIEQKSGFLKVFDFGAIIKFKKNLKFFRILLPLLGILLAGGIFFPEFLSGPTNRLISFEKTFNKPLPFRVEILNKNFKALQQDDFELRIKVTGNNIPTDFFVQYEGTVGKMKMPKPGFFSFLFKSLQSDIRFFIKGGKFTSDHLNIRVFPKPTIIQFKLDLKYPDYLHKKAEELSNISDIILPEGTRVAWNVTTKDAEQVLLRFPGKMTRCNETTKGSFTYAQTFLESMSYSILPENKFCYKPDSLPGKITIIKDAFPIISVEQEFDSAYRANYFFNGMIKDDYGFTMLTFNYTITNKDDTSNNRKKTLSLSIKDNFTTQSFKFSLNPNDLSIQPGETVVYYFEVWDNDGIHGPKSTKSAILSHTTPTKEEIAERIEKQSKMVEDELERSLKNAMKNNKKLDKLQKDNINNEKITWQTRKNAEDLIKSFEAISEKIEESSRENLQNILNEKEILNTNERIVRKQLEINELLKSLLTEEMKQDMEEMKKILDQVDKNKLNEMLEKMKGMNKELEEKLDRTLDLYKRIEFDRKLESAINEIKELAKKMEELSENPINVKGRENSELQRHTDIKQRYDTTKNLLSRLEAESKLYEDSPEIQKTEQLQMEISKDLDGNQQLIENKKEKEAKTLGKSIAKKMEGLAEKLEQIKEESEEESDAENADDLRKILENLINLSFSQEELIDETGKLGRTDPRYQELIEKQSEMRDKMNSVRDSLTALSKRELAIKPVITKELENINRNLEKAQKLLDERRMSEVMVAQQYTMTAMNNLSMLLAEALKMKNLDMQANSKSKGGKACKKPAGSGGKKSMKSIKDLQGKISEQMKKLKEGMGKGKKDGQKNQEGNTAMNQQIARLAAQQEALRRELEKYQQGNNKGSKSETENLNAIAKEMAENERDLIFKKISQESVNRQQKILTRLLNAEKAEETREYEETRQAEQVKTTEFGNPEAKIKYNYKIRKEDDILLRSQLPVRLFYKRKSTSYLIQTQ